MNFLEHTSLVVGLGEHVASEAPSVHRTSMTTTQAVRPFSLVEYPYALLRNLAVLFGFDGDRVVAVAMV